MKPKFRARELWLFAPFLLIGAAALYWGRVEQVSQPGASEMFVSDVRVEAAPGYYQEKGMSHRVTVTVSHRWPRPKWWNQHHGNIAGLDVLHPETPSVFARSPNAGDYLEGGEVLTIMRAGKNKQLPPRYGGNYLGVGFDGTNYVSTNYFDLALIPKEWGAVTLHGLYRVATRHQVALTREVRRAGATVPFAPNRDSQAQMLAIDASPFLPLTTSGPGTKPLVEDNCQFQITLRDLRSPQERAEGTTVSIYDLELQDETGKIYQPYLTPGFTQGGRGYSDEERAQWAPGEQKVAADVSLAPSFVTKGRLRLRGKVLLNYHWPLKFEVELPPRVLKPAPYNRANRFTIPLWREGKPIKP